MANRFTANVTTDLKAKAEAVISQMDLDGFVVDYKSATKSLLFRKEFKVVEVLLDLIQNDRWGDIRHLFRAVLSPGPQLYVHGAENEWSRERYHSHDN
jgi:hypothetical protein